MPGNTERPTLRILCLHGKQQTKEIFRTRLGRLPRKLKGIADFFFIDAPFTLPLREGDQVNTRTWWKYGSDQILNDSFKESVDYIHKVWVEQGPFDGVLGFSMGGSMACAVASRKKSFPGLKFVIAAASTFKEFLFEGEEEIDVDSLHIYGLQDKLVPPDVSEKLADRFKKEKLCTHIHEQGHCFPSRAESYSAVVEYLRVRQEEYSLIPSSGSGKVLADQQHYNCTSKEIAQEQADEIEAMLSIYPTIVLLSTDPPQDIDDPCGVLSYPVPCVKPTISEKVNLEIYFTPSYPNTLPLIRVNHSLDMLVFPPKLEKALISYVEQEIASLEGMQCSFTAIGAAETWLAEPENLVLPIAGEGKSIENPTEDINVADADDDDTETQEMIWGEIDDDQESELVARATEEACHEFARRQLGKLSKRETRDLGHVAEGRGVKKFIVGLVGKPSAGKSTFFNCVTRLQNEAKVGAHPFTTIEPNFGTGWWASNQTADCDDSETEFGRDGRGRRLLPLLVKDVAGLIPGAYKGHGKGNRFLNDLCDADILIHIVDCSGTSDKNGVEVNFDDDAASSANEDVKWVREELHRWIFGNVSAKWRSVVRAAKASEKAAEIRVFELFSGYKGSSSCVKAATFRAKVNLSEPQTWSRYDLHSVVAHFLSVRFPMCLALNKCDKLIALGQTEKIRIAQENGLKLGYVSVPCSAAIESSLLLMSKQHVIDYGFGATSFSVIDRQQLERLEDLKSKKNIDRPLKLLKMANKIIDMFGSTGVLNAISTAVSMREPLLVYPLIQKTGMTSERYYCLQCLPGSCVQDVYNALKHNVIETFRIEGDFIRAEVKGINQVGAMRQCGKDLVLDSTQCVLKILTNRKVVWQQK